MRLNILVTIAALLVHALPASSYSQDPRSCADPRTQYPSYPPCLTAPSSLNGSTKM
jgi:hypothetical protein